MTTRATRRSTSGARSGATRRTEDGSGRPTVRYQGHVVTGQPKASGYAEREAALEMVLGLGGARRITLARRYDAKSFVQSVTPHVFEGPQDTRATR